MEHITKSQMKLVRSLGMKKFRDETGLFVAEGDKCIDELRKFYEQIWHFSSVNATPSEIAQISQLRTPQGSVAVFRQVHHDLSAVHDAELVLVLDGVQDPGNLGTILRTCDWFGVRHVVCSTDTADCYNPKVVQATMGALARVRVHYTDLPAWLEAERGRGCHVFGTLLDGADLYTLPLTNSLTNSLTDPPTPSLLIMGNEGNGISSSVRRYVTHAVRIPSYPPEADTSESLNVAIATAITLAEFRRVQRQSGWPH